ncbi:MAG: ABC transporter permease [Acidobacteriia bacterium]|nr:ABC transporter permease [Terriglobia bacterium]
MGTLSTDIRYGVRMLMKAPGVTLIAVLTLALGIGVNTAVFSVVNAFILRPLPVRDSERLTVVTSQRSSARGLHTVSLPDLQDCRGATGDVFEDIAGYTVGFVGLSRKGERPERVLTTWVTGNYFPLLDLRPTLGRLIGPDEGDPGRMDPVVILGYSTWRQRFGSDPYVIGETAKVNGRPVTIIGVAPSEFDGTFAFSRSELFLPVNWAGTGDLNRRDARSLHTIARLRPHITMAQAQAALDVVAARLERQFPDTNKGVALKVVPERLARPEEDNARTNARGAAVMTVLVGLVLIVAAVNVTNLVLARATGRQREISIRAALGAGRGRLIQQLLTESLMLAALGGSAGVLLGAWSGILLARTKLPGDLPVRFDFHVDGRVLLYSTAMVILAGMIVGVVPALRASSAGLGQMLRDGQHRASTGGGRTQMYGGLVAAQIALCFVLLVAGGLFIRSLARAERMDPGFQSDGVLNLHMDVSQLGYTEAQGRAFFRDIEERLHAVPGIEDLSFSFTIPMGYVSTTHAIDIEGQSSGAGERPLAGMNAVGSHYFSTMRIPIGRGRSFTEEDDERTRRVAIVNERLAEELWPGRDPLGKRFSTTGPSGPWVDVVGVVRTGKYHSLFEDPQPYFYVPLAQAYTGLRVLQVRTSLSPRALAPSIERVIHAHEPALVLYDVQSMTQALDGGYGLFLVREAAKFAGIIGVLGLVLAVVGLYGLASYALSQRTHEIGVRMALGATPNRVLGLMLRQGMRSLAAGIGMGLLIAMAMARLMSRLLYGVTATDPWTFVGVAFFLSIAALGASYMPSRQATRIDPAAALRHE